MHGPDAGTEGGTPALPSVTSKTRACGDAPWRSELAPPSVVVNDDPEGVIVAVCAPIWVTPALRALSSAWRNPRPPTPELVSEQAVAATGMMPLRQSSAVPLRVLFVHPVVTGTDRI